MIFEITVGFMDIMQRKRVTQIKDRSPSQATRHPHKHSLHGHSFFQDLDTFGSRFNLLQEVSGLSTGSFVFQQETSYRTFGQAKIDFEEGFKAWNLLMRHGTTFFVHPSPVSSLFTTITTI